MTTLLENPLPIIVFGVFAEAVLGIVLVRTGRGAILAAMLGVLLLVLAGVGLEWLVVTQFERVEATVKGTAGALQANDGDAVLAFCSESDDPSAAHTRNEARRARRIVDFSRVKINDLKITINKLSSPPTAEARFIAVVSARDRGNRVGHMTRPLGMTLRLRWESGQWLICGHELDSAPMGF